MLRPMPMTEFFLIRHAPVAQSLIGGPRLYGRGDPEAVLPKTGQLAGRLLPDAGLRLTSPARRCRATAQWLWGEEPPSHPGLWEQDFGDWEGRPYADLPDLGPLPRADLAAHRPPRGESFLDLHDRIAALLPEISVEGSVTLVAHAGVVRAFLGLALGQAEAGLAFGIDPLSLTRVWRQGEHWGITAVNLPLVQG